MSAKPIGLHPHTHAVVSFAGIIHIDVNAWCDEYDVGSTQAHEQMRRDVRAFIAETFKHGKWDGLACHVNIQLPNGSDT